VTDYLARGIEERDTAITLRSPLDEPSVAWEKQLHRSGVVGHLTLENRLARRSAQADFKIRKEGSSAPDGERTEARLVLIYLRHECVLHAEGGS
jgi:hypothetical protein